MEIQKNEGMATVIPGEKIDLSNSGQLKTQFLQLVEDGHTQIVLDFKRVKMIDSSGLGKILLFQKELRERDGKLKIVNITSEYVDKMFRMIHLDEVIDIE